MNVLISSEGARQVPTAAVTAAASLEANVSWALAGNILFAACQWGLLITLARLGNSEMVGQFALGLAIATPLMALANLQLRSVQATDAEQRYHFRDYFRLRTKTTLAALAVIFIIALAGHWKFATALVVSAVGLSKAVESLSDIHYGLFQNREQLAAIAKSLALRGTLGLAATATALYLTRSAVWAVAALVLAWVIVLFAFDFQRGGDILISLARHSGAFAPNSAAPWKPMPGGLPTPSDFDLACTALPLGLVTALVSLEMNVPRYFVQWSNGEATLGVFSAIAYLGTLLTVFVDAVGLAATPRLAKYFSSGRRHEFRKLLCRLGAAGAVAGLAAIGLAATAGGLVLRLAYGSEYAGYRDIFLWLMSAAALGCVGTLLTCALTAGRNFRQQIPMFGAVVLSAAGACALLTPRYGLRGAAMAMVFASAVHVALSLTLVSRMLGLQERTAALASQAPDLDRHDTPDLAVRGWVE